MMVTYSVVITVEVVLHGSDDLYVIGGRSGCGVIVCICSFGNRGGRLVLYMWL